MLKMKDIRRYISSFGLAEDKNVYIGKMDNKQQKSIGIYNRKREGPPEIALGGLECTTFDKKSISILIHWSKSFSETEAAAQELYGKLLNESSPVMGDTQIHYLQLMVPEPVDVGTDDNGVYEYVIWVDVIYQREE